MSKVWLVWNLDASISGQKCWDIEACLYYVLITGHLRNMLQYQTAFCPDIKASGHESISGHSISKLLMSGYQVWLNNRSSVLAVLPLCSFPLFFAGMLTLHYDLFLDQLSRDQTTEITCLHLITSPRLYLDLINSYLVIFYLTCSLYRFCYTSREKKLNFKIFLTKSICFFVWMLVLRPTIRLVQYI